MKTTETTTMMAKPVLAAALAVVLGLAIPTPSRADDLTGAAASPASTTAAQDDAAAASASSVGASTPAPIETIPLPAQPPAVPATAARRNDSVLAEIIVTAQRREENLQDVPISMTVFDQKQIADANITNASDLATYTPSLSTNARLGGENATFTIRGFTQVMRTTATVATYFADVVAPRGQSVQNSGDGAGPGTLFDLQDVQVLKGPQGTLFGRNTTGGAVVIVPQKPKDEFGGYAEVSAGDYDMLRRQAVINVPVTRDFKLRLGVDDNRRDGYLKNVSGIGPHDLGDVNYTAARLSAVLDLSDSIENYTILSYVDSATNGYTAGLYACNPSPLPTQNLLFVFFGVPCAQQAARQAAAGQDGFYDVVSTVPNPRSTIKEKRLINTTTWDISDDVRFKNIFAYAHLRTENESDIFGTDFQAVWDLNPAREIKVGLSLVNPDFPTTSQETWVEELQLQGNAWDGRLQWQAGAYYERSMPDGVSGMNSVGLLSCQTSTLVLDPSQYNCFDPLLGVVGSVRSFAFKTDYINEALYSQMSFDLTEQLSVTAGLRYTWDTTEGTGVKTFHTFVATVPQAPRVVMTSPTAKSRAPTGLAEISYKPFDRLMTYAKYSRGYRQGSVNMAADPGIDTFKPEKVNTYELGSKFSFGGPVPGRFNTAVFYNDFKNMQLEAGYLSSTAGSTTAIFNAGKSRIAGAEVEAFFQLFNPLTLGLSYSYLDTKLLEQKDRTLDVLAASGAFAALTLTPIADVGDSLPFAPKQTAVASLNYHLPLPDSVGRMELGLTYVYTDKRRSAASSSTPFAVLKPFDLLNVNLNWIALFRTPVDLSLFATNVLDEKYVTFTSGTYAETGYESRQTGMPRMMGVRLRYNLGS